MANPIADPVSTYSGLPNFRPAFGGSPDVA